MCDHEIQDISSCECLYRILETIVNLQQQEKPNHCFKGCDKPYLGPEENFTCYNTRPISLYNCNTGTKWSFPYSINNVPGTSTVFRVESLDNCCCTCRVLQEVTENGSTTYNSTDDFFTINLDCVSAIQCYADTYVDLC